MLYKYVRQQRSQQGNLKRVTAYPTEWKQIDFSLNECLPPVDSLRFPSQIVKFYFH